MITWTSIADDLANEIASLEKSLETIRKVRDSEKKGDKTHSLDEAITGLEHLIVSKQEYVRQRHENAKREESGESDSL